MISRPDLDKRVKQLYQSATWLGSSSLPIMREVGGAAVNGFLSEAGDRWRFADARGPGGRAKRGLLLLPPPLPPLSLLLLLLVC